jgi:hypothetical protein
MNAVYVAFLPATRNRRTTAPFEAFGGVRITF